MKFSTFATVLTLFVSTMTGQFVHAARDKSVDGIASTVEDRSLRKKPKSKPFEHMPVEGLMFSLEGPNDYDDPTNEEVDFLLDCVFTSYDLVREADPEEHSLSFVALDNIEAGRRNRDRSLRAGNSDYWQIWMIWFGGSCNFCPVPSDDDDVWSRALVEKDGGSHFSRFLESESGPEWEDIFCALLKDGSFAYFASVDSCSISLNKTRKMHGAVHN